MTVKKVSPEPSTQEKGLKVFTSTMRIPSLHTARFKKAYRAYLVYKCTGLMSSFKKWTLQELSDL